MKKAKKKTTKRSYFIFVFFYSNFNHTQKCHKLFLINFFFFMNEACRCCQLRRIYSIRCEHSATATAAPKQFEIDGGERDPEFDTAAAESASLFADHINLATAESAQHNRLCKPSERSAHCQPAGGHTPAASAAAGQRSDQSECDRRSERLEHGRGSCHPAHPAKGQHQFTCSAGRLAAATAAVVQRAGSVESHAVELVQLSISAAKHFAIASTQSTTAASADESEQHNQSGDFYTADFGRGASWQNTAHQGSESAAHHIGFGLQEATTSIRHRTNKVS